MFGFRRRCCTHEVAGSYDVSYLHQKLARGKLEHFPVHSSERLPRFHATAHVACWRCAVRFPLAVTVGEGLRRSNSRTSRRNPRLAPMRTQEETKLPPWRYPLGAF